MQGNVLGQSGGNARLNIFAQPNEPTKKSGIWIKTTEKKLYNKVQIVNDFDYVNSSYVQLKDIPYDDGSDLERASNPVVVAIDTEIYIFAGGSSDSAYIYKYNTLTNTYTQIANMPYKKSAKQAVVVGTDIYLFGGGEDEQNNIKYDTLTDTYTNLEDIPLAGVGAGFRGGCAVAIGTDIYLLGRSSI